MVYIYVQMTELNGQGSDSDKFIKMSTFSVLLSE